MAELCSGLSGALRAPRDFPSFRIGETAQLTRYFGQEQVAAFAELIGDSNPIHLDEEYAANTRFGRCIVHGTLYSGLIGTVLGMILPGPGTILVSQEHCFVRPVFVGDTITATVEMRDVDQARLSLRFITSCKNQNSEEVLTGWAVTRRAR